MATSVLLLVVGAGLVDYASFTITSPVVTVDLRYTVTITSAAYVPGTGMELTAQVLDAHGNPVAGLTTVVFLESTDGVSYYSIGAGSTTDGSGLSTITWTGALATVYDFEAQVTL
ncbi:MAG: hypothetical protein WCD81_07980 [Candidatus Bathyarchaeia archaeon]